MSAACDNETATRPATLTIIHCRKCAAVLGVSSGVALTIGAAVFPMVVTVHCACCGACRKWRPDRVESPRIS